jgi:3-deoxy-7-phosphoheptulonate synthase
MNQQIETLRNEIDEIDNQILSNILKRLELVKSIHIIKANNSELIIDIDRELKIISSLISQIDNTSTQNIIKRIYSIIFQEVKEMSYARHPEVIDELNKQIDCKNLIIAGPCSVESETQINDLASKISKIGVKFFRGGIYKARTNPGSFQGLRKKGLQIFFEAARNNNLFTVSEFLDIEQAKSYFEYFDIIMIGSRNMTNFEFLRKMGKLTAETGKPIILKRGYASTIDEMIAAAEYITKEGNPNLVLCLRGIRTFEETAGYYRFPPDLHSLIELHDKTNLPIIFDPSHSAGKSDIVPNVAKAAIDVGFNGIIVEVHDDPKNALSDGMQAISSDTLSELCKYINSK